MINPSFKNFDFNDFDNETEVFPEIMDIVVSKEDGIPYIGEKLNRSELIPGYKGIGSNHVYTFLAVSPQECPCGYIVIRDKIEYLNDMIFLSFAESCGRGLESCQKNIQLNILNDKLSEIMQQDALTLVKNRTAYVKNYFTPCARKWRLLNPPA